MSIYLNRVLNMKKIKAIGFDMDYTLVRYKTENFEKFTYHSMINKLIEMKKYPQEIINFEFNYDRVIQGLVIDKRRGNILKLSRFGKVKTSYHGTSLIDFNEQRNIYENRVIELSDPSIQSLDTSFAIAHGVIYGQLVELKDEKNDQLPDYEQIANDVRYVLDQAHADGTLKDEVRNNIDNYIIKDETLPRLLEEYKALGKKLIIITNSDFNYTKLLMDYTFNPFLKDHTNWMDLFEFTITASCKPKFFTTNTPFLKVDPNTSLMSNFRGKLEHGIYQDGSAFQIEKDLNLTPTEILYIGDHIFGDVVSLKKKFQWRTALVLFPLEHEVNAIKKSSCIQEEIDKNMKLKLEIEQEINEVYAKGKDKFKLGSLFEKIEKLNQKISNNIEEHHSHFNPYWGSVMRAGSEESFIAGQVEKYACIYMAKVNDLLELSPKSYFRPIKRIMPHEVI